MDEVRLDIIRNCAKMDHPNTSVSLSSTKEYVIFTVDNKLSIIEPSESFMRADFTLLITEIVYDLLYYLRTGQALQINPSKKFPAYTPETIEEVERIIAGERQ